MAKLRFGERLAREATLQVGASALILDETGERVLLTRRTDNGRWCLPGGRTDPGESLGETCVREVREETGLEVEVVRLVGVYSSPDVVVEYADGSRRQIVAAHFQVRVVGGTLGLSDETTEAVYFSRAELGALDLMEHHFADREAAFIR